MVNLDDMLYFHSEDVKRRRQTRRPAPHQPCEWIYNHQFPPPPKRSNYPIDSRGIPQRPFPRLRPYVIIGLDVASDSTIRVKMRREDEDEDEIIVYTYTLDALGEFVRHESG